jgi:hypothetical protein
MSKDDARGAGAGSSVHRRGGAARRTLVRTREGFCHRPDQLPYPRPLLSLSTVYAYACHSILSACILAPLFFFRETACRCFPACLKRTKPLILLPVGGRPSRTHPLLLQPHRCAAACDALGRPDEHYVAALFLLLHLPQFSVFFLSPSRSSTPTELSGYPQYPPRYLPRYVLKLARRYSRPLVVRSEVARHVANTSAFRKDSTPPHSGPSHLRSTPWRRPKSSHHGAAAF